MAAYAINTSEGRYRVAMDLKMRGRGRPRLADVEEIRLKAIEVLLERGYTSVSMERIATEVGLSVRTLHRYFPTKADIVWGGIEGALDALSTALSQADQREPVMQAVTEAVIAVFDQAPERLSTDRARIRLIAITPELEAARPETYRRWREHTIDYIARRLGTSSQGLIPRAAGAALHVAIMEALAWWAVHTSDESPTEAIAHALQGLAVLATETAAGPPPT